MMSSGLWTAAAVRVVRARRVFSSSGSRSMVLRRSSSVDLMTASKVSSLSERVKRIAWMARVLIGGCLS